MAAPNEPRIKLVVCGTHRCGSTMLCEDLSATGILGNPREDFASWLRPNAEFDVRSALDQILRNGTTENGVFSTKLMSHQIKEVDRRLQDVVEADAEAGRFPHVMGLFTDAVWIFLRRDDLVRQAISHLLAKHAGVYHLVKKKVGFLPGKAAASLPEDVPDIAPSEIADEIARLNEGNLVWRFFFEANRIEPITLVYEDIASGDRRHHLATIAERLGVGDIPELPPRNLQKMSGAQSEALRARFLDRLCAKHTAAKPFRGRRPGRMKGARRRGLALLQTAKLWPLGSSGR